MRPIWPGDQVRLTLTSFDQHFVLSDFHYSTSLAYYKSEVFVLVSVTKGLMQIISRILTFICKCFLLHYTPQKPPSAFKVLCKFMLRKEFLITLSNTLKGIGGICGVDSMMKHKFCSIKATRGGSECQFSHFRSTPIGRLNYFC